MLWTEEGRKHGTVHGEYQILVVCICLLALTPSGIDLAGLVLTYISPLLRDDELVCNSFALFFCCVLPMFVHERLLSDAKSKAFE